MEQLRVRTHLFMAVLRWGVTRICSTDYMRSSGRVMACSLVCVLLGFMLNILLALSILDLVAFSGILLSVLLSMGIAFLRHSFFNPLSRWIVTLR